ncbi:MAG: hypothetical protein IJ595_00070, partial [Oscillospiraceae bacterium]|nr:hypothetical protein [Oscillospiraceae bacterium]
MSDTSLSGDKSEMVHKTPSEGGTDGAGAEISFERVFTILFLDLVYSIRPETEINLKEYGFSEIFS